MPQLIRTPVDAPLAAATRNNLLQAARVLEQGPERFPLGGIAYNPHSYGGGHSFDPSCEAPGESPLEDADGPTLVEWDPAAIYWVERCDNPTPEELEVVRQRALAGLEVHRSDLIERILWTNHVNGTDLGATHPNVGLADTPGSGPGVDILNGGAAMGPVAAISALVGALAGSLHGVRGAIHVPVEALPFLDFYGNSVVVGGGLLAGSVDHQLVAGSGYDGSGPDGSPAAAGFTWFYATSPIEVRLGPVVVPDTLDHFTRTENTVQVWAQQPIIVSWDRGAHHAVQVCLTDPGPECAAAES